MLFCCFLCHAHQQVVGCRFINGMCGICAGTVTDVRVQNVYSCCFVPVCWLHRSRIICCRCGAQYKSRRLKL